MYGKDKLRRRRGRERGKGKEGKREGEKRGRGKEKTYKVKLFFFFQTG